MGIVLTPVILTQILAMEVARIMEIRDMAAITTPMGTLIQDIVIPFQTLDMGVA